MMEAVFGLVGVFIGAGISWFQTYWFNRNEGEKAARYLAIRIVCIFDKFLEDCVTVVKDTGEPLENGIFQAQEKSPDAPIYPDDVDWKSIGRDLMYEILSFPSDVKAGDRIIAFIENVVAFPPDYEEFFEERAFQYAQFGLRAHELATKLRKQYSIPFKKYDDWDPALALKEDLLKIQESRKSREKERAEFMKTLTNPKETEALKKAT